MLKKILFITLLLIANFPAMLAMEGESSSSQVSSEQQEVPTCGICLMEFENAEKLRSCKNFHIFHEDCINGWRASQAAANRTAGCPTCREPLTATVSSNSTLENITKLNRELSDAKLSGSTHNQAAIGLLNKKILAQAPVKRLRQNDYCAIEESDAQIKEIQLFQAVNKQDHDLVKQLLEQGASVNAVDNEGSTPLFHAIRLNNAAITELLLQNGSDVLHANNFNGYPYASADKRNASSEIKNLLVEYGRKQAITQRERFVVECDKFSENGYGYNFYEYLKSCLNMLISQEEDFYVAMTKFRRDAAKINELIEQLNCNDVNPFYVHRYLNGSKPSNCLYLRSLKLNLFALAEVIFNKEVTYVLNHREDITTLISQMVDEKDAKVKEHFIEILKQINSNL